MAERKFLMTARNGMQVWVPESKLEQWQKAQEDQSPEAQERRRKTAERILAAVERLSAQGKSE